MFCFFFIELCRLFLVLLFCRKQRLFWKQIYSETGFLNYKKYICFFLKDFKMIYDNKDFLAFFLIDGS